MLGGNDVQLTNILNQCIYQWAVANQAQASTAKLAALDKDWAWASKWVWDAMGRGCEKQLEHTQSIIDSPEFSSKIDRVLEEAKKKLSSE